MAYTKTTWQDGVTPLGATNLNKIEQGIADVDATIQAEIAPIKTKNREQDRLLAYHEAWHEIDGRATPNSGKFADLFYDRTKIDSTKTNTTAALAATLAAITFAVKSVTGFKVGQEVTIFDDVNLERRIITGIDVTNKTLTFALLEKNYKAQATVCRSSAIVDTVNRLLKFGGWEYIDTYDRSTPTTVVAAAYDTSGNGGRKSVRLSNGWLVYLLFDSTYGYRVYKSEDNGVTGSQLTGIKHTSLLAGASIVSDGTKIRILSLYNFSSFFYVFAFRFDATSAPLEIDVASDTTYTKQVDSQSGFSGCSLSIDSNGYLHAAWASKNGTYPNSFNIRYSKSTDGGATWASVTQVTTHNTTGLDNSNPSIVVNPSNNRPIILGAANQGTSFNIIRSYVFDGTNFTFNTVYQNNGYTQNNPSADVDGNGHIHVTWHGTDSGDTLAKIRYSKSTDGGANWSAMAKLMTDAYVRTFPSITVDKNNKIYILYHGGTWNGSTGIYQVSKITNDGSGWSVPIDLTSFTTNANHWVTTCANYNDFTDPLAVYKDPDTASIKFRGVFQATKNTPVLVEDVRYNITPPKGTTAEVVAWVQRQKGDFTVDGAISIVDTAASESFAAATKTSYDLDADTAEDEFLRTVATAEERVTLRLTMNRTATSVTKGLEKILGAVG
jgi:hypothetical protein